MAVTDSRDSPGHQQLLEHESDIKETARKMPLNTGLENSAKKRRLGSLLSSLHSKGIIHLMYFLPLQDSQWLTAASTKMATRAAANICVAAYALQERSALVTHHFPKKSAKKKKITLRNAARPEAEGFAPAVMPTIEPIEALGATRA
jgi:hypothetical protein